MGKFCDSSLSYEYICSRQHTHRLHHNTMPSSWTREEKLAPNEYHRILNCCHHFFRIDNVTMMNNKWTVLICFYIFDILNLFVTVRAFVISHWKSQPIQLVRFVSHDIESACGDAFNNSFWSTCFNIQIYGISVFLLLLMLFCIRHAAQIP